MGVSLEGILQSVEAVGAVSKDAMFNFLDDGPIAPNKVDDNIGSWVGLEVVAETEVDLSSWVGNSQANKEQDRDEFVHDDDGETDELEVGWGMMRKCSGLKLLYRVIFNLGSQSK